jgi:hypothetical protein
VLKKDLARARRRGLKRKRKRKRKRKKEKRRGLRGRRLRAPGVRPGERRGSPT